MFNPLQLKKVLNPVDQLKADTDAVVASPEVSTETLVPEEEVEETPVVAEDVEMAPPGPDEIAEAPVVNPTTGNENTEEEKLEEKEEPVIETPERDLPDAKLNPYNYAKEYFAGTSGYSWNKLKKYYRAEGSEDNLRIKEYLADKQPSWEEIQRLPETYIQPSGLQEGGVTYIYSETKKQAWIEARNHLAANAGEKFTYIKVIPEHKRYRSFQGLAEKRIGSYNFRFASEISWKNVQLNQYEEVSYELLLLVSGDQENYDDVMSKKSQVDRLRNPAFVNLVANARKRTYPEGYKDREKYWVGLYTRDFHKDLQGMPALIQAEEAEKKKKQEVEEKRKEILESGERVILGKDPKNSKYLIFERHGKRYHAYQKGLYELLRKIRSGSTEAATDLCTDMEFEDNGVDLNKKEMEAIFAYLAFDDRAKLLEMFAKEWWMFESQEKAVNQILKTTPVNQRERLAAKFYNKDKAGYKKLYTELRDLIDNDETRRNFFTETEVITGRVDDTYFKDLLKRYEARHITLEMLINGTLQMSDKQLKLIPWETRKMLIDRLLFLNNNLFFNYDGALNLIKTADPDTMRSYLLKDNADGLAKVVYFSISDEESDLRAYLDKLFGDDHRAALLKVVRKIIKDKSIAWDYEVTLSALPESVFHHLTHEENADIIKIIVDGKWTGGRDEKTILRILRAVGGSAPLNEEQSAIQQGQYAQYQQAQLYAQLDSETQQQESYAAQKKKYDDNRQAFYDVLKKKGLVKEIEGDTHGYNYDAVVRAIAALNYKGRGDRQQELKDSKYKSEQDDILATWSKDDFAAIETIDERISYLKMVLGDSYVENDNSWVGNPDEKTILLIIETTPARELTALFERLKEEEGELYKFMERSMHFSEYQELHDLYGTKAEHNFYASLLNDPHAREAYEAKKNEMQKDKLSHPQVIPFSDPGILNPDKALEYIVNMGTYTDPKDGESKTMIRIEWYNSRVGIRAKEGEKNSDLMERGIRYFDPQELIGVYHLREDSDVKAEEGDVKMMPAINLFYLENKQTNRQIMELVDIASLALALVGVPPGASAFIRALAMADIVLSAGNLIVNSYKDDLPEDVRKFWDSINLLIGAVQITQLLVALKKGLMSKLDDFERSIDDALKAGTLSQAQADLLKIDIEAKRKLGKVVKEISEETDLARLGTMEEILSANPKHAEGFQNDLLEMITKRKAELEFDADIARQLEAPKKGPDPKLKSQLDEAGNPRNELPNKNQGDSPEVGGDKLSSHQSGPDELVTPNEVIHQKPVEGVDSKKVQKAEGVLEEETRLASTVDENPKELDLVEAEVDANAAKNSAENGSGGSKEPVKSGTEEPSVEKSGSSGGDKDLGGKKGSNEPEVSLGNKGGASTEKVPAKYSTKIDDSVEVLKQEELFGDQATTFLDAQYRTVRTTEEVTTYRAFGGDATVGGSFVTTTEGASRADLALLDEWNNTMRFEARIKVPEGEVINVGKVGPQTSKDGSQFLVGGGDQIILPFQWDTSWVDEVVDLTTGNVYRSVDEFEEFVASTKKATELDGAKAALPNSNNGADDIIGGLVSHKQNYLGQIDDALKSSSKEVQLEGKVGDWFRDELVSFNKKIPPKTGAIGEIDVELKDFIIEVTVKKKGKLPQIEKYLTDPQVNPLGKKVILYSEDYNWRAVKDIEKAGGYVATSKAELFDIINKVRSGN